eukprot:5360659-Amphidinium_carterae.1
MDQCISGTGNFEYLILFVLCQQLLRLVIHEERCSLVTRWSSTKDACGIISETFWMRWRSACTRHDLDIRCLQLQIAPPGSCASAVFRTA